MTSDLSQYLAEDTIAAVVTALGGPVAIIRVSGSGAGSIVQALSGLHLESQTARLASVHAVDGRLLDQALVVTFISPQSFTGEDVVEFHLHGSSVICEEVMAELGRQGARQALPGEFSFRAVKNGKMSLVQALGVRDLLSAASEMGTELAAKKATGLLDPRCDELRQGLIEVAARAEIGIDFSDQDAGHFSLKHLRNQLAPSITLLQHLEQTFERGRILQDGIRVALCGAPNSGKSSLFNALVGESAAIVHDQAGTTRDVIERRVKIASGDTRYTIRIADTAGLRDTVDAVEKEGVERAEQVFARSDIVLWCIAPDALGDVPADGRVLSVHTKADLRAEVSGLSVSSKTGEGLKDLENAIAKRCAALSGRPVAELLLTSEIELRAVQSARGALERAHEAPGLELLASDVRFALKALGPVIGGVDPEDVLGQVFSKFCIGK